MKITAFEAYQHYIALKQHFTTGSSYDYFKYGGRVNIKPETFLKRNDRYMFDKLAKREDANDLLVACLSDNPKLWIGDIVADKGKKIHSEWAKRQQSLAYSFKDDISRMEPNFDSNFQPYANGQNGPVPILLWLFIRQQITIETMVILNRLCNYIQYWDNKYEGNESISLMYEQPVSKIKKYDGFLEVDLKKYKKIIIEYFKKSC